MKRGSFVAPRRPMPKVSAKVKRERAHEASEYAKVNARSQGRCEVTLGIGAIGAMILKSRAVGPSTVGGTTTQLMWRCPARATDHHHLRKPRRLYTFAPMLAHLCRRHHDMVTASYRVGRLIFHDLTALGWECEIQQKENKWA